MIWWTQSQLWYEKVGAEVETELALYWIKNEAGETLPQTVFPMSHVNRNCLVSGYHLEV